MHLARAHNLSSYDASYLELAIRLGLPLAAQDGKLKTAAQATGVPLFQVPLAHDYDDLKRLPCPAKKPGVALYQATKTDESS